MLTRIFALTTPFARVGQNQAVYRNSAAENNNDNKRDANARETLHHPRSGFNIEQATRVHEASINIQGLGLLERANATLKSVKIKRIDVSGGD